MSSSMKSNNYKNTVKGLRKLTIGKTNEEIVVKTKKNSFSFLEDDAEYVEQYFESSNELTRKSCREKNGINFDNLPEDMINLILGFLPYNTRLAILKCKYNKNYIKSKIGKIPKTIKGFSQIWKCAEMAKDVLENLLEDKNDIFKNLSRYSVEFFKKEKHLELYLNYYTENFTKIIWAAIQHYSKMYKFKYYTNKKIIKYEKKILNIFAHLSIMK